MIEFEISKISEEVHYSSEIQSFRRCVLVDARNEANPKFHVVDRLLSTSTYATLMEIPTN